MSKVLWHFSMSLDGFVDALEPGMAWLSDVTGVAEAYSSQLGAVLGDGIRLYDNPGGEPIRLHNLIGDDPHLEVDLRYAPVRP